MWNYTKLIIQHMQDKRLAFPDMVFSHPPLRCHFVLCLHVRDMAWPSFDPE